MSDVRAIPAGDYDYESGGQGYALRRRTDPRIAALVHAALGGARSVGTSPGRVHRRRAPRRRALSRG